MRDGRVELRRRLLGYDPEAVERLLADREAMVTAAAIRAKEAEERAAELERELARRDEEMAALRQQVEQLANDVWAALEERTRAQEAPPPPAPVGFVTEELARVVQAAEESATAMIRRAWEATRDQISEVDRLWREVQEEIVRFAAWRQHVEPMVDSVRESIREASERIAQVPERILEAVRPAVEAMAAVDRGIAAFAEASSLSVVFASPAPGPEGQAEAAPVEGQGPETAQGLAPEAAASPAPAASGPPAASEPAGTQPAGPEPAEGSLREATEAAVSEPGGEERAVPEPGDEEAGASYPEEPPGGAAVEALRPETVEVPDRVPVPERVW